MNYARQQGASRALSELPIDFEPKYFIFRAGGATVLRGDPTPEYPKGKPSVFGTHGAAVAALAALPDEDGRWEIEGPVQFAMNSADDWWYDEDNNPWIHSITFLPNGGKPQYLLKLWDGRRAFMNASSDDFVFDFHLFSPWVEKS